jgi:hypothetical protein
MDSSVVSSGTLPQPRYLNLAAAMNDEAGDAMLIPSTTKLLNVLHNKDDLGWRATAAEAQTAHCNAAAVWLTATSNNSCGGHTRS